MALFFHKENNAIYCLNAIPQTYASKLLPTITLKSLYCASVSASFPDVVDYIAQEIEKSATIASNFEGALKNFDTPYKKSV